MGNVVRFAQHCFSTVNGRDKSGFTPLCGAIFEGNISTVSLLLSNPAVDVNKSDKYGRTPLFIAVCLGHTDIVRALLDHPGISGVNDTLRYTAFVGKHINCIALGGQDIDIKSYKPRHEGWTPLYVAAYKGLADIVNLLLEYPKIQVNKSNKDGYTPLHV
eukprot:138272_1